MSMKLPPEWATNENYSSGPDVSTPTKVDPATSDNGFIRGTAAAAQHVNFLFDAQVSAGRRTFLLAACKLRLVSVDGVTVTDTLRSLAAVQRAANTPLLLIKVDGARVVSDWSRVDAPSALASITDLVTDAATDGSRIVVVGFDGTDWVSDFSDDDGANWTAGGSFGGGFPVQAVIWNDAKGKFVAVDDIGTILSSTNGVAWANTGVSGTGHSRIGALANGNMIAVREYIGTTVAFNVSTNTGVTWTNTGGTVSNGTDMATLGCVAGNNGAVVYYAGARVGGGSIEVSSSADGVTWALLASLSPPAGATFNATVMSPSLRMCQNTGLLVVSAITTDGQTCFYASPDGSDWVGPVQAFPVLRQIGLALNTTISDSIGVAGGKLLATHGAELFASDGIGF